MENHIHIRCLRPNESRGGEWDSRYVYRQLEAMGVISVTDITSQHGRMSVDLFTRRYGAIIFPAVAKPCGGLANQLARLRPKSIRKSHFNIDRLTMQMTEVQRMRLECLRERAIPKVVTRLQAIAR